MNRKFPFLNGEYYHIYNRGVDKRDIFSDKNDLYRFVESIIEFNNKNNVESLEKARRSWRTPTPPAGGVGVLQDITEDKITKSIKKEPIVSIFAYCLNPNHFHFFVKQEQDNGISKFMQKLQGGYTNYFNTKYERSGALFQGKFKAQIVKDENYFVKAFGYVNKNYLVHSIPEEKKHLVFASDYEYENKKFKIISEENSKYMLEKFGGLEGIKKHSKEIIDMVRQERGKEELENDSSFL